MTQQYCRTTHYRTFRQTTGFTLVELLVVIGIITVLISMTMPVIKSARNAATNLRCQTNLRELSNAYRMYSQSFKDQVPLGYQNNTMQNNYTAYFGNRRRELFPMLLVNARLLKMPQVYFCPAEIDDAFSFNTRTNPWPPVVGSRTTVRVGYGSRPIVNWPNNQPFPRDPFPRLTKLGRKAILSDLTTSTFALRTRHKKGVNVAYADGSVDFVPQKLIARQLPSTRLTPAPAFNTLIFNSAASNPSGLWVELDKAY